MPVLFIGHGSPLNAIEENEFSEAWTAEGHKLPLPRGVVCVSAHWETSGTRVSSCLHPETIHDFSGFSGDLYAVRYAAPGSPDIARELVECLKDCPQEPEISEDPARGFDHGAWSVLLRLFPDADVPVVQLSLDWTRPPDYHYALGKALGPLRSRGLLIVASGNIVHNLGLMRFDQQAYDWAEAFDTAVRGLVRDRDDEALVNYGDLGGVADLAVPTNEHYLPFLYALALRGAGEDLYFFTERISLGSISMRSFRIG
jgi:4,5-DOPA dioxygenase extradiol